MEITEITKKLNELIVDKLGVHELEIKPESKFKDLGADSLDTVELIMEIENIFNVKIADNEMEILGTVQDVINLLEEKTKQ